MSDPFADLKLNESRVVAGKIYHRCLMCQQIIRIDKPLVGSMHICLTEDEEANRIAQLRAAGWHIRVP